jgi:hypothetical protein
MNKLNPTTWTPLPSFPAHPTQPSRLSMVLILHLGKFVSASESNAPWNRGTVPETAAVLEILSTTSDSQTTPPTHPVYVEWYAPSLKFLDSDGFPMRDGIERFVLLTPCRVRGATPPASFFNIDLNRGLRLRRLFLGRGATNASHIINSHEIVFSFGKRRLFSTDILPATTYDEPIQAYVQPKMSSTT